jgi:protein-L-isoaspartate(D-aspartate) O-methyltransferase
VIVGDGSLGYAADAPFDAILVAAGAPRIPAALTRQLSPDGGRLVIPIGPHDLQRLTVVTRQGDRLSETVREPCVFVPLIGDEGWHP